MRVLVLLAALALAGCDPHTPSPRFADDPMYLVNIAPDRLLGTWYEVATLPAALQEGCTKTNVTYGRAVGGLSVINRCTRDGRVVEIRGTALPVGPGQFKIALDGVPMAGDLFVIGQSRDGRTVLIGTPSRLAGWMFHRDRHVTYDERVWAAGVFRKNGYDEAALQRTAQ